jgi:pyruvate kinase
MALTKIVATVGPATTKKETLCSLIKLGVSIFRFNLKHNTNRWHNDLIEKTKEASEVAGQPIAILLDFPWRIRKMAENLNGLSLAKKHDVDFLAISFVHNSKDIEFFKKQTKKLSLSAKILAKIETRQSLKNFEEILDSADGIMISRGDLGKEIPLEEVPYYQKMIIKRCLERGKPVITATEMLESMINNPFPTRAEISDIANAVLDYTDAVMLSGETATGKYPIETVSVMEKVCRFWEKKKPPISGFSFDFPNQTAALCYSAYQLWMSPFCQKEKVKAFGVLTKSGLTCQMLARLRPNLPIFALTPDKKLKDRLCLVYGVIPLLFEERENNFYKKRSPADISKILVKIKKAGGIKKGEKVILVYAEDWGTLGKTNILRIQEIP